MAGEKPDVLLIGNKKPVIVAGLESKVTLHKLIDAADKDAFLKSIADKVRAFKLSLNDFIIKAWAAALQRIPAANAVWAEDRILRFQHSDIGVAVAIEGGLITPVILSLI